MAGVTLGNEIANGALAGSFDDDGLLQYILSAFYQPTKCGSDTGYDNAENPLILLFQ